MGDSISHKWSLYQQNDERKITSTEWHNLVVRNKAAEICENIWKGDKIYVEGRIKMADRGWDHKHTSEIQVTDLLFCLLKRQRKQQTNWQFWIHKKTNFDAQNNGAYQWFAILIV
jgi:single-strand DNA-binding protein